MTRSAKAKKAKKADFAKVKLKVGRRLKKAQNETRTDFKARKIILKEQLSKKSEEALLTKKKRNVKDLLMSLSHTNTYVRQDGLNGLLELVKKNETEVLVPKLSQIVTGVAPCLFDIDLLIRSAAMKFIDVLLLKVGSYVEPYFNVLATHLSCAMVHLNSGVQADSLRLVHLFVRHTPALLARHANTLLNNFVNLISRKASKRTSSKREICVDFTRMLHTNPSHSLTTQKGHVELLQELSGFLEVVLKEHGQVEEQVPLTMWQRVVAGSLAPVMCGSRDKDTVQHTWLFSNPHDLQKFVHDIVPLLFQVWAEVDPKNQEDVEEDNLLSEEGVKALSSILSIISHLINITKACTNQQPKECEWFVGELNSQYMSKIMSGFPYYRHSDPNKTKKRKNKPGSSRSQSEEGCTSTIRHCIHLNVTLASLAVQLSSSTHFQEKAVSYLTRMLSDKTHDGEYHISTVVKVLLHLLAGADQQEAESLVSASLACYKRHHPLKKDRPLLLQVLLAATHITNPTLWQCQSVELWVQQVVEELAEGEVQDGVLGATITLRLQANTSLTRLMAPRTRQIRENLERRGVLGLTEAGLASKLRHLLKDT